MIVLDTNVLSALMRREVDQTVVTWLDLQPSESAWTTAVTVFEIRFGLKLLAPSRRKRQLGDAFSRAVDEDFQGRILPFDHEAALEAASRAAERRAAGRSVDFPRSPASSPHDGRHSLPATARTALSNSSEIRRFTDFRLGLYSNGNGARFSALMYSAKSFSRSSSASLSVLSAGNLLLIFAEV